jgi:ABC-type branched-subunit amino acid transport system ATPase component/ABC-type branched-subunit amino acid transport system permease subunit
VKASNTERLTPVGTSKWSWVGQLVMLGLLLTGPENVARVISLVTSVITFPVTRDVSVAGNRYEVFNLELLMVYLITVMGLNLLMQTGYISIGTTAPFAIGAYFVGSATTKYGWSFYWALLCAGIAAGLVGFALGLPALRLGVFTFAMVSLGYAMVANDLELHWQSLTGGGTGLAGIGLPSPFSSPHDYYYLLVIVLVAAYVFSRNWIRSPMGRASAAIEASPVAARSVGISPHTTKLWAFAASSAFAGVAGGLYAALLGFIAPDSFTLDLAVLVLLMVLLGGSGTVAGPIIGAIILFRIPLAVERVTNRPGQWSLLVYGAVLLLSVHFFPRGIMSGWQWLRRRFLTRGGAAETKERSRAEVKSMLNPTKVELPCVLEVEGVAKTLSGVRALRGVDISVTPGTVHALIGPNGSGKTTMLNVMSGYLAPDEGTVRLMGQDVTHMSAHVRAQRGLARTFQTPFVFENALCRENVMIALDQQRRNPGLAHVVRLPSAIREERATFARAGALLEAVGLSQRITAPAGDLPPGERRLLELARVLALEPKVVLMDEPAAGLTGPEIEELEESIRALREVGVAVLLVEHHVDFVLRLADVVTVIDFGQVIAHGPPQEIRNNPAVLAAYLGEPTEELEAVTAASGALEEEAELLATTDGGEPVEAVAPQE